MQVVQGTAKINGAGLDGATVTLMAAKDNSPFGQAMTDAHGAFTIELPHAIPVGTLVVATAKKDGTVLNTVFAAPAAPMTVQQAAPRQVVVQDLLLDLASTIVTKKLMPKFLEVIVSSSGTSESQSRIAALAAEMNQLVTKTAALLAGQQTDQRVQAALNAVLANPDVRTIEAAANALAEFGGMTSDFHTFVERTQQATIENIREGGAVITPQRWQVGKMTIAPPLIVRTGPDTLTVTYAGKSIAITTTAAAFAAAPSFAPILDNANPQLHNTFPASGGGGGGNGGGVPASTPTPPPGANKADASGVTRGLYGAEGVWQGD